MKPSRLDCNRKIEGGGGVANNSQAIRKGVNQGYIYDHRNAITATKIANLLLPSMCVPPTNQIK